MITRSKLLVITVTAFIGVLSTDVNSRMLECPEPDAMRHAEATATSAPEIKIRARGDHRLSSEQMKSMTSKALRLAREQRATAMQEGIQDACPAPQIYMGEIAEHRTGCETRLVTRPADADHEWAQVVAICKYDWSCCAQTTSKPKISAATPGVILEGPIATQTSTGTVAGATKPAKN